MKMCEGTPDHVGGAEMMQERYWIGVATMVALALVSTVAERRHARRTDLDRIGWVAWPLVQFLAIGAALVLAALAITER